MKNIALIVNSLQRGGAERCAADLSLIFSKRGFRVFILTDLTKNITYEYAGKLISYDFDIFGSSQEQKNDLLLNKVSELMELKNKYNIDISISFMQLANYLNILSKNKEKVILTTHSLNSEYAKYNKSIFWSEETFRDLYQYADVITFPSEYCRNDWLMHYGDKFKITKTVNNPVHMMKLKENKTRENIVITVGRMHSIKRQWHLIKAFRIVKDLYQDSRLVILGDGELRPKLEAVIAQYNLINDVDMPGNVENVQDYLAKAKVFVITSRCEAMPCSVLEALSAGVPVVSCDSPGGIREELGISNDIKNISTPLMGVCGILTPYIQEDGMNTISCEEKILAGEIVRLLKNDKLRTNMVTAAEGMLQKFSADVIGDVWIDDIFQNNLNREINIAEFWKILEQSIYKYSNQEAMNVNMYIWYYRLLEKWMILHENGETIGKYFVSKGIDNIIIYGWGKMANHLMEDIRRDKIQIVCVIDRGVINRCSDYPIISLDDPIPDADCIVITPVYETEAIRLQLNNITCIPTLSLLEILDECMR